MRSSTIVLAVGLLAAPLSLVSVPNSLPDSGTGPSIFMHMANAQTPNTVNGRRLEDAPVPGITPGGISPAERAGGPGSGTLDAGPANGTPFSAAPIGTFSQEASETSQSGRAPAPTNSNGVTPNLSR